ncbi:MAG TPA: ATP-binding protein [Armatimonadota bacterium]|jgi:hypothetical protein
MEPVNNAILETYFAPAERAGLPQIQAQRAIFLTDPLAATLLEAIPDLAMVLNAQRQVVAANHRAQTTVGVPDEAQLLGLRPGELLSCIHVGDGPNGCGTSESCQVCGAANAILDCLRTHEIVDRECRIRQLSGHNGGTLELEVRATLLDVAGTDLVVLALHDLSGEKRRLLLEGTFFHDVLNLITGLQAIATLLSYGTEDPETEQEYKADLRRMAEQLGEEVVSQRQLLAAEKGELKLNLSSIPVADLLAAVAELYRNHSVARGRNLQIQACADGEIETDVVILRRVLGNLVKNALEATQDGGTVCLAAEAGEDCLVFRVSNPGVMPPEVQKQIFQRSFSTKSGSGHGIGTHSVKLFGEKYLGGQVDFTSSEPEGTVFAVSLPRQFSAAMPTG